MPVVINEMELQQEAPPAPPPPLAGVGPARGSSPVGTDGVRAALGDLEWRAARLAAD